MNRLFLLFIFSFSLSTILLAQQGRNRFLFPDEIISAKQPVGKIIPLKKTFSAPIKNIESKNLN